MFHLRIFSTELSPVLSSPPKESHWGTGMSPVEGHQAGQAAGAHDIQGEVPVQPGEKMALGRPYYWQQLLHRHRQGQSRLFSKCKTIGQKTTDTSWNMGNSSYIFGFVISPWGWWNIRTEAQRCCISCPGGVQESAGHKSVQPGLIRLPLSRQSEEMTSGDLFWPELFYDSIICISPSQTHNICNNCNNL